MGFYRRNVVREFAVARPLQLHLHNHRGNVEVRGEVEPRLRVKVDIEVYAESDEDADRLVQRVSDGIRVEGETAQIEGVDADFGDGRYAWERSRLKLSYEVAVPHATEANLTVDNGRLEVRRLDGPLDATAWNGQMRVEDIGGDAKLHVANGKLEVRRCGAGLEVKVENGPVEVREVAGALQAEVTNGPLQLREVGGAIEAQVLNGPVAYRGKVGADFDLRVTNGPITLDLPSDSRFALDAEAHTGVVSSDFEVREEQTGSGPAPTVRLRTDHGPIRIQRREPAPV